MTIESLDSARSGDTYRVPVESTQPEPGRLTRLGTSLWRGNGLFWLLLAAGALLRLATSVGYRPAFLYPDSKYYLTFAIDNLRPGDARATGYSLFIRPLLQLQGIDLVAITQHALALVLAGAIYLFCVRWGCPRGWAALATLPVLLDPFQLVNEHYVLADFLGNALIAAALMVIAWPGRTGGWSAAAAGLIIGLAVIVRSPAVLVPVAIGVYVLASRRTWRRRLAHGAVLTLAFCLPVLTYMAWMQHVRGSFALSSNWGGRFLYAKVAPFATCDGMDLPDYERPLCPTLPPNPELHSYYLWDLSSPQWTFEPPPGMTANEVAHDFAMRVIRHQPLDYAKVVVSDFLYDFSPIRGRGPEGYDKQWAHRFQKFYPASVTDSQQIIDHYGGSDVVVHPAIIKPLNWYGRVYIPGVVFGACLLVGLAAGLGLGRARSSGKRLVALLFTAATVAALAVPAVLGAYSPRYMIIELVIGPVAGVLGGTAILGRRANRSDPDPADAGTAGGDAPTVPLSP